MKPTTTHIHAPSPETHTLAIEKLSMYQATSTPSRLRTLFQRAKIFSFTQLLALFLCYCLILQPNAAFASPVGFNGSTPATSANNAGTLSGSTNASWSLLDHVFSFFEGSESGSTTLFAPVDGGISRKVPILNNGRIDGNLRVYTGENFAIEGGFVIKNETYVVGTPNVTTAPGATLNGTVDESGSPDPSGYTIAINGSSRLLGKIHRRSDPVAFPSDIPTSVPAPTGTRSVTINTAADLANLGDWSTIKDLHVNKSGENLTVPAGNYGAFSVTGNSRLNLTGGVYNFADGFTFSGNASIKVTGVTTINVGTSASIHNTGVLIGENTLPGDIKINVLGATLTITGNANIKALVRVPNGTATVTGSSLVRGQVIADKLEVTGNGQIVGDTSTNAPGDTTPPDVTITSPANNATIENASVTVTGTAIDPGIGASGVSSVLVNGNSATYNSTNNTFTANVALNFGTNTITVRATDVAGNTSPDQQIAVVRPQDTTPPTVAITSPANNSPTEASSITVSGTVSDTGPGATGVAQVTVNGAPATLNPQDGTWTIANVSLPTIGNNEITAVATDVAGNSSAPVTITVNRQNPQDTTAPTISITEPTNNFTTPNATITVSGTATDDGANATGISRVVVNGQQATYNPQTNGWTANVSLSEGSNSIAAYAEDNASPANRSNTATITVNRHTPDTAAPTVTITDPLTSFSTFDSTVNLTGTAQDIGLNATGVQSVSVNGTPATFNAATNQWSVNSFALAFGPNHIVVIAVDGATPANQAQAEVTITRLQLQPPTLTITNPVNGAVVSSSSITVAGIVASDLPNSLTLKVNDTNTPITGGQFARTVQLNEGSNTISVVAKDAHLQETQASVTVIRDVTAPAISFVNIPTSVQPGGAYQILVNATDNVGVADVELRLNGQKIETDTNAPYQFTLSIPAAYAAGVTLVLSAVARDLTNATTVATAQLTTGGPGGISGYVFDDTTGYVMQGVNALLNSSSSATSDEQGVFSFVSSSPTGMVRLSKDGYTPVERLYKVAIGEGTALFDARLTPLSSQTNSIGASGGTVNGDGGRVQVNFVAGSLSQQTDLRVTSLSPQGLANLLPYGWSPVPGAIIDVRAADGTLTAGLQSPAQLSISEVPGLASTTLLTLVRYDETTHLWTVIGVGLLATANGALTANLPGLGQYAFLVADAGVTAPPAPVVGQPLPSTQAADSAALDSAQATAVSAPRSAPFSTNAKSTISFFATAPAQLPSGVSIEASFGEAYNLLGGKDSLLVDRPSQDFVLYAYPAVTGEQPNRLGAFFIAKPTRTNFSITELFNANVHVEIRSGRQNKIGALIDSQGGGLRSEDGSQLLIPANAVSGSQSVFFATVPTETTGANLPAGYEVLAAFDVDLNSASLNSSATISVPGLTGDLSRVVVAQLITVGGQRSPKLVARAVVDANGKLSSTISTPPLPAGITPRGIRSTGRYLFIRVPSPIGYLKGTITDAATSTPQSMVKVSVNQTPFIDLTGNDGQYLLVGTAGSAPIGVNQIGAAALATDATGTATASLATEDAVASTNIALASIALQVESITPATGAQNMIATTPVTVTFNKPIAAQTLTGSSFTLSNNAGNPVLGSITVLAGSRVAIFTPAATLAASTTYKVSLTTAVRDIYGHALGAAFNSTFTTAATVTISGRLRPDQIVIGYPDANGNSNISIPAQSVPDGSSILVVNTTSGSTLSTMAGTAALNLQIQARVGDEITLTITQPDGTQYSVTQAAYRRADGFISVGSNGGTVTSDDGQVLLSVPVGAISGQADIKLSRRAESDITIPRQGEMDPVNVPFGAGVRINVSGNFTNNKELHLEVAAPPGAAVEGQRVAFMTPAKITDASGERDVWEVVTSGKTEGGKFKTMSPPFFGVTIASNLGFVDYYVFVPRTFRAVTGIVTERVNHGAPKPLANVVVKITASGAGQQPSVICKTATNGRFGTLDFAVASASSVDIVATDTLGRTETAGATPYLNIDPIQNPGLNGLISMFAPIEFPSSEGLPETLPALLQMEGRMLDLQPDQPDTLRQIGRVRIGSHLEITTRTTPDVKQITGQLLAGGTVVRQLVWTNTSPGSGVYVTDFTVDAENSYSVAVTTHTQANVPATKATASFNFVALQDPNTRPSLEGPPRVLSVTPADKALQVNTGTRVHLEFSEPVKNLVAGQTIYLKNLATGEQIGGEITSGGLPIGPNQPNINSIDLQPSPRLEAGKEYAVEVTTSVKDSEDNALDQEYTSPGDNSQQPFRSTFKTFNSLVLTETPPQTDSYRVAVAGETAITVTPGSGSTMHIWDIQDPAAPKLVANKFVPNYATTFDIATAETPEDIIKVRNNPNVMYETIAVVTSLSPQDTSRPINLWIFGLNDIENPVQIGVVSLNISNSVPAFPMYVKIHHKRAYIGNTGRGGVEVVDLEEAINLQAQDGLAFATLKAVQPNGGYGQEAKKQKATYGHSNNEAAPVFSLSLMDQNVPAAGGGGATRSPVAYVTATKPKLFSFDFHATRDNDLVFSDGNGDTFDDHVLGAKDLNPAGFALDVRAVPGVNLLGQSTDLAVLLGGDRLWIFNVTNPRDPIQFPSRSFAEMGLGPDIARRMDVEGTLAYVMFTDKVVVIDFSDPARPYVSSTITDLGTNLRWLAVRDGFVYTLDATGTTATARLRTSIGGAAALVYVHGANTNPDNVCANPVLISRTDNRMLQDAELIFKVYGHDVPQTSKVIIRKQLNQNTEVLATVGVTLDSQSRPNIVVGRARWSSSAPIDRSAIYTAELILDEGQPTQFRARPVDIPFSNLIDQYQDSWGIPQNGGIGYLPYLLGGNANLTLMMQGQDGAFHTIELENGTSRAYGFHNERIARNAGGLNALPSGIYLFRLIATASDVPGVSETVEGTVTLGEQSASVRQPGNIMVGDVELESGNVGLSHNDIPEIKNRGLSLSFTRFYNSIGSSTFNPFGYGWRHNYQVLLTHYSQGEPNNPNRPAGPFYEISGGEGSGQTFLESDVRPGVNAPARAPFQGTLRKNADNTFDFFTRGGIKYHFNQVMEAGSAALFNLGYMGNLAYIEEPNGNRLTFSYDGQGRLFSVADSSNRKLEFTYEQAQTPFVGTVDSGSVTGQATNCTSRRFMRSLRQRFLQAQLGLAWRINKVTGPGGLEITYDYDGNGNLQRVGRSGTDGISQSTAESVWQYSYNPTTGANANPNFNHLIKSVKAPNQTLAESRLTTYEYDLTKPGRPVTSVNMPEGVSLGYNYTFTAGRITSVTATDGRSNPTVYQFANNPSWDPNNPGQLAKTVTKLAPRGAQTVTTFDGFGNRLSEVDPEGKTTTARYEHGNMVEQVVTGQGLVVRTSASYDLRFNKPTSLTNGNQQTTQVTVDNRGNITRVQLPTGRAIINDYSAKGDLERTVDQFGFATSYENFDAHGNPQTIRRQTSAGNFVTTQETFDIRSRLKTSSGDLAPTVSNTYDALDHLVQQSVTDPSGFRDTLNSTMTYLIEGQVKSITHTGSGQQMTIVNEYDALNRVISTTETPSGSAPFVRPFKYDRNSNLEEETDRRGVKRTYTYDALNFVTSETLSGPHGPSLSTLTALEIDKVGNAKLVRNLYGHDVRMSYDALHRLSTRQFLGTYTEELGYDANGNIVLSKDRNGRETRYEYDAVNRRTAMRDPAGRVTTWTYDDSTRSVVIQRAPQGLTEITRQDGLGRLLRSEIQFGANSYVTTNVYNGRRITTTDPRGTVIVRDLSSFEETGRLTVNEADPAYVQEMRYAAMGGMRSRKDALNRETTFTLDGLGRATQVGYPGGFIETFVYDGEGSVLSHTDRRGALTTMTYDNMRRPLTQKVQDGAQQISVLTTQYDDAASKETRTDANGHATVYVFDGLSRLSSLTNADNKTKSYFYDGVNLRREGDFKGLLFTEYEYDAVNRVKLVRDRKGQVTNITNSDNNGYVKTTVDRRGNSTVETHDAIGRLTSIVQGGEPLVSYQYDENNNRIRMTDGVGNPTTYTYDKLNRVKTIKHADLQTETFNYDAVGNVLSYNDGHGPSVSMEYDELNHLKLRTDGEGNATRLRYDGEGLLLERTDPKGAAYKTTYTYNALRSLKTVSDAKSGVWQLEYDGAQNLKSVRDALTRTVSYDYDPVNRLQKITQPQSLITLYGYDANSNRTSVTDPKGQITTTVYDELDRPDTLAYTNTNGSSPLGFDFDHDPEGNLTGVAEQITPTTTRSYTRSYDTRNRLQKSTDPFNRSVTLSYYATNKLKSIKDASEKQTSYTYDAANRLQNVNMPNGSTAVYDWFADGLLKSVDYGAGMKREYSYDNADRLTQVTNTIGTDPSVQTQQFVYGYDPNSNRSSETRKANGQTTRTITYTYDLLDRLTAAAYTTPGQRPANPPAGQSVSYTEGLRANGFDYDAVGNRTIASAQDRTTTTTLTTDSNGATTEARQTVDGPLVTTTSQFDALNRLTQLSNDAPGNVPIIYAHDNNGNLISTTQNNQVTGQYEYDCRDQLRRVLTGSGQEVASYDYDFQRHRLAKTVGTSSLRYVYGGDQVIGEYNASNQLQNRYDVGSNEVVRAELAGEGSRHYFGDGLNSVTALGQQDTATTSSLTTTYEYDAWGNYFNTVGTSNNSIGYTAQRVDGETGLMPLGNGERYYSPALGRFIQQDSFNGRLEVPQSLNRYGYVHGNPVNHTDPSGHFAWFLIGFLALMAVGVATSTIEQNAQISSGARLPQNYSVSEALVNHTPVGGTFRAFTGTDPVSLEQLTAGQQAFEIAMLALDLAPAVGEIAGMVKAARAARASRTATVLTEGLGVTQTARRALSTVDEVGDASRVVRKADEIGDDSRVMKSADEVAESGVLRFDDDPLVDANVLVRAADGNAVVENFLEANRGLLSYGRTTRYEFLRGGSQRTLSRLSDDFDLMYVDDIPYSDVIAEGRKLRRAFDGDPLKRVLTVKDSRQLATARLTGIDFVTSDLKLFKRAKDLGINVHYLDAFPEAGGALSKAAQKAANYVPIPVVIR